MKPGKIEGGLKWGGGWLGEEVMGGKEGAEGSWSGHPDGPGGLHSLPAQDAGGQVRKQRHREVGGICFTQMPVPAGPGDSESRTPPGGPRKCSACLRPGLWVLLLTLSPLPFQGSLLSVNPPGASASSSPGSSASQDPQKVLLLEKADGTHALGDRRTDAQSCWTSALSCHPQEEGEAVHSPPFEGP